MKSSGDTSRFLLERQTLMLTLGMFASKNAKTHPEDGARAQTDVQTALRLVANDEASLSAARKGGGNETSDDLAPDIAHSLSDKRPNVRETAADALRNVRTAKGMFVVDKAYTAETDPRKACVSGRIGDRHDST